MKKLPLADYLVTQGLCADKKQAAAFVMAGKVLLNERPAKPGSLVKPDDCVRLKDQALPYASKGGLKLEGALKALNLSAGGKVCLDAGASTGGFTDCLLQHGAALVYAVDVGFGQLTGALRQDPRVINLERTNLGDPVLLSLNPRPEFATCDLSYLSLKDAVPLYRQILGGRGQLLALVKPLFELKDMEARRTGQVDPAAYAPLLNGLIDYFNEMEGTRVTGVCASPITGNAGTLEFFLSLQFDQLTQRPDLRLQVEQSVEAALMTSPYKKAGEHKLGPA